MSSMRDRGEVEVLPATRNRTRDQLPHGQSSNQSAHTYGCLDPIEIKPLDALIDDIHRTQAHIIWLEHYIAHMPTVDVFTDMEFDLEREQMRDRVGKPIAVGSIKWQLEMSRRRSTITQRTKRGTHPAVKQLMEERRHMADVATKAVALGIKLDAIDFSRQQADMIIEAMGKFALTQGLSPTDPVISQNITDALEFVLKQRDAT